MAEITKAQYENALERIEKLLPYVGNLPHCTSAGKQGLTLRADH